MTSGTASHAEFGKLAIELASGAANLVRARTCRRQDISTKSTGTDLVTETDRASERWLTDHILARRPDDAILGEEDGERSGSSGVRWIVDPIDGTVNFVLGLPQYAVSVATEVGGEVVAGAVCNPATGELLHAVRGGGAYLRSPAGAEERLGGPRGVGLANAVVGTGFGYQSGRRARQIAVVAALLPRIADIRRLGAASLDLCAVAAGRLDAYFEVGLQPWDYAAGVLIATEAGCLARGLDGAAPSEALTLVAAPGLIDELGDALVAEGIGNVL